MPRTSANADPVLGAVLRRFREERGTTLEVVAFHAGVTYSTLGRIELGQANPTWMTVRRVARALDVTLLEIATAVERAEAQ
ncbi:MAG TPA: helix-turn-helix transcriptional regulator [Solirubrobacteraceae bacterium]|nr:helix-turn-helix transcriptional regulator [Solirubrobacteraceae bacterium]